MTITGTTVANSLNTSTASTIAFLVGNSPATTTFNGDVTLDGGTTVTDNSVGLGGRALDVTGKFVIKNNITFGPWSFTDDYFYSGILLFDGTGSQTVTDNAQNYYSNPGTIQIGSSNNPTVTFTLGSGWGSIEPYTNLTVNGSSTLIIPTGEIIDNNYYEQNTTTSGTLTLAGTATLKLAGTTDDAGLGSNMPSGFTTYSLSATSTVVYNGASSTAQNVYEGTGSTFYGNLTIATSGSGPGGTTQTAATGVRGTLSLTTGDHNLNSQTLTIASGGNIIRDVGTLSAAPTFTGTANLTYIGTTAVSTGPEMPTASGVLNNLTFNKSGGVTLATTSPTVNGILAFQSGIVNGITNSKLISVTATANTAVTVIGTTSFMNGQLKWAIGTGSYIFPVGNTSYLPFTLVTSASSSPIITLQAYNSDAGASATFNSPLTGISHTEYWNGTLNSGSFTGKISLTRQSALTTENMIGQSGSVGGAYSSINGLPSGTSINTSDDVSTLGYFVMATGCRAPVTQAYSVGFASTGCTGTTVSWTRGNGSGCKVFMYLGSTGTAAPANNTDYTANAAFGTTGTQIGSTGWYCVYSGTGTSIAVTNLTPNSTYRVHVCEYNCSGTNIKYFTSTATNNPNNVVTTALPSAPTGSASQTFCTGATVANLAASGSGIQWYAASSGGSPLVSTTALVNNTHYFASQTITGLGCESSSRLDVTATVNQNPTTSTNGGALSACQGSTSAALGGNTPSVGSGLWTCTAAPVGGQTSDITFTSNTTGNTTAIVASGAVAGAYTLRWTISNTPCTASFSTLTLTVNTASAISLTSGTQNQAVCTDNPAIATTVYTFSGSATNASVTTLPAGLNSNVNTTNKTVTISGSPTASGTYTITTSGHTSPCTAATIQGTITLYTASTISLTSGTQNQAVCSDNPAIAQTVYTFGGSATYASVTNLPAGLNSNVDGGAKTVTISGSPTATGTYTITTSGNTSPCTAATIQGIITFNTASTIALTSGTQNQTVCSSSGGIVSTVYTFGGSATNANVTNLPAGLSSNVNTTAKTVTISGTATAGGTYTITTSGHTSPCAAATISGIITYNLASTATAGGPNEVCQSATPAAITLSGASFGGGATTGAWSIISGGGSLSSTSQTASPGSVTYTPVANYNGSVTLRLTSDNLSTCSTATSDRTITVRPLPGITTSGIATAVCYNTIIQSTSLAYGGTSNTPISYSIDWDAAANTAGLIDQTLTTNTFAPGSGTISTINIPDYTASGDFDGTMTITTTYGCTATQAVSVTVISNSLKPVITSTLLCGATSVFGNTSEHGAHTITVYDDATSLGYVSVPAGQSNWLVAVTPALIAGNSITAQISGTICASFPSDPLTVEGPNAGTVSAASPATLCIGATGQYSITAGDAGGSWTSGTPSVASVDALTGKVTALTNGTSIITYTVINGTCSKTATKTLTVSVAISAPTVSASGGVTTICKGGTPSSVTLTASGGTTYLWSNGVTGASITVDTSGSYTVRVTNGCGSTASAATVVTVNAPPVGKITGATPFCVGTTNNLTVTATAGNSTITNYQWYNTGVSLGSANGAQTTTYTASQPGTYTVLITDSNGCTSVACP